MRTRATVTPMVRRGAGRSGIYIVSWVLWETFFSHDELTTIARRTKHEEAEDQS
jgi:hypothetical protein